MRSDPSARVGVEDMKGGLPRPSGLRRRRQAATSIVARLSTRPSAHETSFTLSLSLSPSPSVSDVPRLP